MNSVTLLKRDRREVGSKPTDSYGKVHQYTGKNGRPFVDDPQSIVVNEIMRMYDNPKLGNTLDRNDLVGVFANNDPSYKLVIPLNVEKDGKVVEPQAYEADYDGKTHYTSDLSVYKYGDKIVTEYADGSGSMPTIDEYRIQQVKESDVVFLPVKTVETEHDSYHVLLGDQCSNYNPVKFFVDTCENGGKSNESFEVVAFTKNDLAKNEWYKNSVEVMAEREELGIEPGSKYYSERLDKQNALFVDCESKMPKQKDTASLDAAVAGLEQSGADVSCEY